MDPTERIDIDRFDIWLDELARGVANPAPDDTSDLAQAAIWLHQKGEHTMTSRLFQQRLASQLQPATSGDPLPAGEIPQLLRTPATVTNTAARLAPRRWMLAAAAIVLLALPLAILVPRWFDSAPSDATIPAPINGLAQSGTPVPCSVIPPATLEISGTPVNEAVLLATANRPYPNVPGAGGPVAFLEDLPSGPPASPEDVAAIQQTLAAFSTCIYERDLVNADALFSDDSFRRSNSDREQSFRVTMTPDPTVAWIPTPIRPLDALGAPITPVILRSNVLPDGRTGVLLEQDITGYGLQEYFILVQSDRGWLIDETVNVIPETRPSPEASPLPMAISAIDLQFQPSRIEIPADVDVTLVVTNDGQARKTFVIPDLVISEELPVGKTISVVVNAPKGVYEFYSDVPGQKAAGMKGWLIVIPRT